MDIGAVATILTSLKTATDMVKTVKEINDDTKRLSAVIELQSVILDAQAGAIAAQGEQLVMTKQISVLESQIANFENWNTEVGRYKLTDFGGGTFAYDLRMDAANGEPNHKLCANCVAKKVKSILQFQHRTSVGQDLSRAGLIPLS